MVITAFGRVGCHSLLRFGVTPDIITTAKGLTNRGGLPMGRSDRSRKKVRR